MAMAQEHVVELTADDRQKMRELQREITQRFKEMAHNIGRALGDDEMTARAFRPGGKFTVRLRAKDGMVADTEGDGQSYCIEIDGGAWEYPPGWCRPGGC